MNLTDLLNIPVLQALGIILLIGLAERIGIPVVSTLKSIMKLPNGAKETNADTRNAMQTLLSKMELLTTHFNHDTTQQNERIIEQGEKTLAKLSEIHDCIRGTKSKVEEMQKYGVKTLKE